MKSYLENKTLVETLIVIGESGEGQLLRNIYKRESKHHKNGPGSTFEHSKPMKEYFNIYLILLQFQHNLYSDS